MSGVFHLYLQLMSMDSTTEKFELCLTSAYLLELLVAEYLREMISISISL